LKKTLFLRSASTFVTPVSLDAVVGFIGPAICLIGTGFIECSKAGAVGLIVFAVGLSGISMAGWAVNHLDLAPPYAGKPLRCSVVLLFISFLISAFWLQVQ